MATLGPRDQLRVWSKEIALISCMLPQRWCPGTEQQTRDERAHWPGRTASLSFMPGPGHQEEKIWERLGENTKGVAFQRFCQSDEDEDEDEARAVRSSSVDGRHTEPRRRHWSAMQL